MRLHDVLPALISGKEIRRVSAKDLRFKIGTTGAVSVLVMFSPGQSSTPIRTQFDADDILAGDWEEA